jgi:hypothetical protein
LETDQKPEISKLPTAAGIAERLRAADVLRDVLLAGKEGFEGDVNAAISMHIRKLESFHAVGRGELQEAVYLQRDENKLRAAKRHDIGRFKRPAANLLSRQRGPVVDHV